MVLNTELKSVSGMLALFIYQANQGGLLMNENTNPCVEKAINPEALEPEADCAGTHLTEEDEILVKDAKGQTVKLEVKDDAEYDPA